MQNRTRLYLHFVLGKCVQLSLIMSPPLVSSVDLNAADTGVQLKSTVTPQDRKQPREQKQDGCSC